MNSSLVENLDSIRNVVGEITSRIDKINTDYGYDNSLSLNKPSSRISKKKSYIFVTLVVVCLIILTYSLSYFQPWFVKKKEKFINVMNWWMVFFCDLFLIFLFMLLYAYLSYIQHPLLTIS
jgi:uncharacterized BrkB/YihY/UPF0761 family membrane protein